MENGALLHELRPFEQSKCEEVEGLLWSGDGQFILAVTKAHGFFTSRGIGVWSMRSGKHRAELAGCPTNVRGVVLLDGGRQIAAGANDGVIGF